MSVDASLPGLLDELRYAEQALTPYTESWKLDKEGFYGKGYRSGKGRVQPENHALEWISLMRGQMLMGDPRVRITSNKSGDPQVRAQALTMAINQVTRRNRMRDLNEQLLMDFAFKWAVCLVKSAPAPGFDDEESSPLWPVGYRISPLHFRYDVAATRVDARQWSGHLVITSRTKLKGLADHKGKGAEGWKRAEIDKLEAQDVKKFRDERHIIPNRDEVAYWEIWCPGVELPESPGRKKGYYGTIFTVVDNQAAGIGWIRDPYPAFVPPWGPYVVGGDYLVPDESAPLGPLSATSQQANHLNRIKRATIQSIENYKRLIFVRNSGQLVEQVKSGKNDFVFGHDEKNIQEAVHQVEIAGVTEQHFVAAQDARNTLDGVSGITDMMRGRIDSKNKATQEVLASQAAGNRTSGTVSKFHDLVTRIIYSWAYMIDRDDNIEVDMGPEAEGQFVDARGKPTTVLKGGHHPKQDPEEFFGYDFELQVGSMERDLNADMQFRLGVIQQTMQEMAAMGPQMSLYMDVQKYLDSKAEITGVRELRDLFDVQRMQVIGAMMLQNPQAGQSKPQPQQTPQPSFSGGGGDKPPAKLMRETVSGAKAKEGAMAK